MLKKAVLLQDQACMQKQLKIFFSENHLQHFKTGLKMTSHIVILFSHYKVSIIIFSFLSSLGKRWNITWWKLKLKIATRKQCLQTKLMVLNDVINLLNFEAWEIPEHFPGWLLNNSVGDLQCLPATTNVLRYCTIGGKSCKIPK